MDVIGNLRELPGTLSPFCPLSNSIYGYSQFQSQRAFTLLQLAFNQFV